MMELEQERKQIFGTNHKGKQQGYNSVSSEDVEVHMDSHNVPIRTPHDSHIKPFLENGMSMEERNEERDLIYNFTPEETQAWAKNAANTQSLPFAKMDSNLMNAIHQVRAARDAYEDEQQKQMQDMQSSFLKEYTAKSGKDTPISNEDVPILQKTLYFTHLNEKGDQVSMVDVGHKTITRRVAKARSIVYLPPEVMDAFAASRSSSTSSNSNNSSAKEMMSTKGPIFSTARIAGIMGAKRTCELIPLCHPLPLDNVHIDIWLDEENSGNRVIVECTCSVTHKTGVEMEALTGASIAALTIYDMVKAVSHRVRIESTELIRKSGGKRNVNHDDDCIDTNGF